MSDDDERDRTDQGLPPLLDPCVDGWLWLDTDHPVPCPRCRPHLHRTTDPRTGLVAWRASKEKR